MASSGERRAAAGLDGRAARGAQGALGGFPDLDLDLRQAKREKYRTWFQ